MYLIWTDEYDDLKTFKSTCDTAAALKSVQQQQVVGKPYQYKQRQYHELYNPVPADRPSCAFP